MSALVLPNNVRIGDFNNDGLQDIYLVSEDILLQSQGQLGFAETALNLPIGDNSCLQLPLIPCPDFAQRRWDQILDFNGDGLVDFVQVRAGQVHILRRKGPAPALLQQVTGGPLTPEIRFAYRSTPEVHTPGNCSFPQNCLHRGMWLVSEVGIKANVPDLSYPTGFNRILYSYSGGRFDVRGRGWLGFSQIVSTDEQTGAITTTDFDNVTTLADSSGATYRYTGVFRPVRVTTVVDARTAGEQYVRVQIGRLRRDLRDPFWPLLVSAGVCCLWGRFRWPCLCIQKSRSWRIRLSD